MDNLMQINHANNIFIAKGKVRHVAGGPVMALVGFIHYYIADKIFEDIGETLSANQKMHLSEKICIVEGKGIGFYPSVSSTEFYGHIFNSNGQLGGWYGPGTFSKKFSCLVRYYDESKGKFIYNVFSPLELELA